MALIYFPLRNDQTCSLLVDVQGKIILIHAQDKDHMKSIRSGNAVNKYPMKKKNKEWSKC